MRQLFIAMAICALTSTRASAEDDPWAAMARRDLNAIHVLINDSHPGTLDSANPGFRRWLETGHRAALNEASGARSLDDFQRVLRRFINGFRDNHMRVRFEKGTDQAMWAGFSTKLRKDGKFIVTLSEEVNAPVGAEVLSCDNIPITARFERDVLPFTWNPELLHAKAELAASLFVADLSTARPEQCLIAKAEGATPANITLSWRAVPAADAARLRRETNGLEIPPRGIREIDGVTLISLPSMDPDTGFSAFFDKLEKNAAAIRQRPIVVFDVRGNRGGHTAIGHRLLSILFGDDAVERIVNSFDWSNKVRASPGNAERYRKTADFMLASGAFPQREVDEVRKAGDRIDAAVARGDRFLRGGGPGQPPKGPAPPSPFTGRVYFLTDSACASACLDMADVARRLPGVIHIGLPTEADAVYMESRHEMLPSGLARLTFGIKVVLNRIRKNNEWYEPRHRWPGGKMSDEALAKWVRSLK